MVVVVGLLLDLFDHIRSDFNFHDPNADMLDDISKVRLSFDESRVFIEVQSGVSKKTRS